MRKLPVVVDVVNTFWINAKDLFINGTRKIAREIDVCVCVLPFSPSPEPAVIQEQLVRKEKLEAELTRQIEEKGHLQTEVEIMMRELNVREQQRKLNADNNTKVRCPENHWLVRTPVEYRSCKLMYCSFSNLVNRFLSSSI